MATACRAQIPQRFPRAGSQSYPTPAAVAERDGSTVVHIGPTQPDGVERSNWIQTRPGQGWFVGLRHYSPPDGFSTRRGMPYAHLSLMGQARIALRHLGLLPSGHYSTRLPDVPSSALSNVHVPHRPVNTRPQGRLRQRRARKLDADSEMMFRRLGR